ncbi:MAG: hypothetical protein ACOH10_07180 [Rhodoglobus sp.]
MDACAKLVRVVELIAIETSDPRRLLVALGTAAAGIRTGPLALIDLARGGRNHFPGRGMASEFDDDSDGQARHFAGIATSAARVGPTLTRWLSIVVGRDAPSSPDGRLTDLAVEFARALLKGDLATADAADWLRERLCD